MFEKVKIVHADIKDIDEIKAYEDDSSIGMKIYGHIEEVPASAWDAAVVKYTKFYGFTEEGTLFHNKYYHELDMEIAMTLDFSTWFNHIGTKITPSEGDLIAGVVAKGSKGKMFKKWFVCSPQLKLLIDMVLAGKAGHSENDLAEKLLYGSYPDTYWAIARLLFFDNVQAFVDQLKSSPPIHPAKGKLYKKYGKYNDYVSWSGMYLPMSAEKFIQELSNNLGEPMWLEKFNQLKKEQGL